MTTSGCRSRRHVAASAALALSLVLPACGGADGARSEPPAAQAGHGAAGSPTRTGLPSAHVHGVAVDPADGRVHLATHDGLYRYDADGPVRVGPVIDLMGFAVAGPGRFYASGHPGPGVDLPQPVGLLRSVDGGRTWSPLSRQGVSDFHALAVSDAGIVGFDGAALRSTEDGLTWRTLPPPPVAPHALAVSPDGAVLLATSESGLFRSADGGTSWSRVSGAPLLQVVDWADGTTVVGVTPRGSVASSADGGLTWSEHGDLGAPPQAVAADVPADRGLRVVAVTVREVLVSTAGAPFAPLE